MNPTARGPIRSPSMRAVLPSRETQAVIRTKTTTETWLARRLCRQKIGDHLWPRPVAADGVRTVTDWNYSFAGTTSLAHPWRPFARVTSSYPSGHRLMIVVDTGLPPPIGCATLVLFGALT